MVPGCHVDSPGLAPYHLVTHAKEILAHKGLGEEVGDVVVGRHKRYAQQAVLDALSDEIVTSINVLRLSMMLGVVREINS